MAKTSRGTLISIGGHEDKEDDRTILRAVREHINGGKLVVTTVATTVPQDVTDEYVTAFAGLGVKMIEVLDIRSRADAYRRENIERLDGASTVFFTGGDQLRITAHLGGSPLDARIREIYQGGGTTSM